MRRALVLLLAVAAAGAAATAAPAAGAAKVNVGFSIDRFVEQGGALVAQGRAVATYTAADGTTKSATKAFRARARVHGLRHLSSARTTCQVLYLELDKLSLTLLGLDVNLDKVVLTLNADSSGGVLGSLFCKLANSKVSVRGLSSAARRLTSAVHAAGLGSAGSGLGFGVPLTASTTSATGSCQVLDLVLGPLDLKLLGLIATLNQVHLTITADASGGVLGSLFCTLAHATATAPLPTTTTTP